MPRGLTSLLTLLFLAPLGDRVALHQVSGSPRGAFEASLTPTDDGFVAAWHDTRGAHSAVYFRLLDVHGTPVAPERRLTDGTASAYEPDLATIAGHIAVAWYEKDADGAPRPMLGVWTKEGRRLWARALSSGRRQGRNPVVRASGARLFCAWLEYDGDAAPEVWAAWFDVEGRSLDAAQRLAPASRTTWNLNAAIDREGRPWVVFDARVDTRANEVFAVSFEGPVPAVARLTDDDGHPSTYPDVAFSGDRAALTWLDTRDGNREVYLSIGPPALSRAMTRPPLRVTRTSGESSGAYLAWNGSRLGLAWNDVIGGQAEIHTAAFDGDGRVLSPGRRITYTRRQSLVPAIRPSGPGFILAWNEFERGPHGSHDEASRSQVFSAAVP